MRLNLFFFLLVLLVACSDQFEMDESYLVYESPTLLISNGSGVFYDTIKLSQQNTYNAQIKFKHGNLPGNVTPAFFGDGSFPFNVTTIGSNTIHITTLLNRPGVYSFQYYWLQKEPHCQRILGQVVLVRLVVIEDIQYL